MSSGEAAPRVATAGRGWTTRAVLLWVAWTFLYLVSALLSRRQVDPDVGLALFWPAGGIAAAWSILTPRAQRVWVGLAVLGCSLLSGLLNGADLVPTLAFGVAHGLQAVLVGVVYQALRPGHERAWPETPRCAVVLLTASIVAATVTAPIGAWAAGAGEVTLLATTAWLVRNSMSILVVGALVLELTRVVVTGSRVRDEVPSDRRLELVTVVLVGTALSVTSFADGFSAAVPFASMALLVWVGSRFRPTTTAVVAALLSLVAVWAMMSGHGPFTSVTDPFRRAIVLQLFAGLGALVALTLSYAAVERARLTAELERAHRQALHRAQLLVAVSRSLDELVLVVDSDDQPVWVNQPRRRSLSRLATALPHLRDLEGQQLAVADLPHHRAAAGADVDDELVLLLDDEGGRRVLTVSAERLTGFEEEERPLVVVVLRDVTHEHERLEELRSFADVVAHDLGSPANLAADLSRMTLEELDRLEQDGADVELAVSLTLRTQNVARRMNRLVSDLRELTMADRDELRAEPVELRTVVDDVVRDVADSVPDARIEVVGDLGRVLADRRRVRQLMVNLVRNAVKYTPPDRPAHVVVSATPGPERVAVMVADEGIGIPEGELESVFEPLRRASNHGAVPGTGLGLAICARVVDRHGGTIAAMPNPHGVGTVVAFDLPAVPGSAPAVPESRVDDDRVEA